MTCVVVGYEREGKNTALFGGERNYDCPLRRINLEGNQFGSRGMAALLPFLKSKPTLKYLNLSSTGLSVDGARLLSESLQHIRIEKLDLAHNDIGNDGVNHILSAENSKYLVELHLLWNGIEGHGIDTIFHFLQRDDTMLKMFFINNVDEEETKHIIDSIQTNQSWSMLIFVGGGPYAMIH